MTASLGELESFFKKNCAPVDVCWVKNSGRNFAGIKGSAHEFKSPFSIAKVEMQYPSLACDEPSNMAIASGFQQVFEGWLARTVIRERNLTGTYNRIQMHDVAAEGASQSFGW
jgi:hypothetical protein|tara:strand:- start:483 stop:821 length:339 start_codon:yes stop_codon:yes gene_type:complete